MTSSTLHPASESCKFPNHFLDEFHSNQFPHWCFPVSLQWGRAWEKNGHNGKSIETMIEYQKSSHVSLNYILNNWEGSVKTQSLELEPAWSPRANAPPNLGRETGFHLPRSSLTASRSPVLLTPSTWQGERVAQFSKRNLGDRDSSVWTSGALWRNDLL